METEKQGEAGSVVQERLNWQVAYRDDRKVGQALYAGEPIDEMHQLSDAGLLDEFFVFLKDVGMLEAFEQVSQAGVKRTLVPTVQFVLLYVLKVLLGGESMHELPHVLFSDLALMELVGFNAHQCESGLTKRGDASRTTKKKQGPLTAQCLADNICKIPQEEMERLFNRMVQLLAGRGLFSGKLVVALDGSKLPTPRSYQGCGKLKQTRSVKVKGQKEAATEEYYVYGWKVLVLLEVQTRLPLAMKLITIQEYEGKWLVPLLEQAQHNLGTHAHIETIVVDRGYLDGEDLWRVHQKGVLFVICGKASMAVTQDAQGVAKGERASVRERVVRHGHGKSATEQRLRTELVGVEALTSYDQYGDAADTHNAHRKDYVGQPINAVVVHCHLTVLVMGLTTAFRLWQQQQASVPTALTTVVPTLSSALLGGEGIARWRQRLHEENRDKIIVFIGHTYGIFHLAEFAILTHLPLRILPSSLGSPQAVLQRFGLSP